MIEPFYLDFGKSLKAARMKQSISQDNIADMLNLSRVSIANIESGRQRILAHQASQLAYALKFDIPEDKSIRSKTEILRVKLITLHRSPR